MRNLKKFLALALAMVMAFSLMLTASAIDYDKYTDKDTVTEEFEEAVAVLSGLKIMEGDGPDDAKTFRPADTITRAEAAAVIYRIATGDVENKQVNIYADYGTFTDVKHDDWFAGYVGYCQNAGYIKGDNATTFRPYGKVTGYEMLAMILRVVGYGKNNEFTGGQWQINVASLSKDLGVTNNVKNANFDTTLSYAARRDVVADLAFQTIALVPTVNYNFNSLGYGDRVTIGATEKNPTLGQKIFGLYHDYSWSAVDKWGTPGYKWYQCGEHARAYANGGTTGSYTLRYDSTWLPVYGAPYTGKSTTVATITIDPTATFDQGTVRECDVAHELKIDTEENFNLYVNGKARVTDKYLVVATDTVTKVGGQGRVSKFWYKESSKFAGDLDNWCTMVDTYLAKVTDVTPVVKDAAGHIITNARLYLDEYDGPTAGTVDKIDTYLPTPTTRNTSEHVAERDTDWTWSKGDYVLIQGWTDKSTTTTATTGTNRSGIEQLNKTAFETDRLGAKGTYTKAAGGMSVNATKTTDYNTAYDSQIDVLKEAPKMITGKQTVTYWNQGKHTVDGTDYLGQLCLFLDEAGTTVNTTYAWYFDQYGNLIGIGNAGTSNFGVITSIYSSLNQGDASTDGTAKAIANVKLADGTDATYTIDRFLVGGEATSAYNAGGHKTIAKFGTLLTNAHVDTLELRPVYDYNQSQNTWPGAMQSSPDKTTATNPVWNGYAADWAELNVAPVASTNAAAENNANGSGYFGIIKGNLFKFVSAEDGKMVAVEVAGKHDMTPTNHAANENSGIYEWNYNSVTSGARKLLKNAAYFDLDVGETICVDGETKIIVRNPNTGALTTYDGTDALPGDVSVAGSVEIDWADPNSDGTADVIYLPGTIDGTITYGLFYYNGGAGQWTGGTNGSALWPATWVLRPPL